MLLRPTFCTDRQAVEVGHTRGQEAGEWAVKMTEP